jgi:hypothetical protein
MTGFLAVKSHAAQMILVGAPKSEYRTCAPIPVRASVRSGTPDFKRGRHFDA